MAPQICRLRSSSARWRLLAAVLAAEACVRTGDDRAGTDSGIAHRAPVPRDTTRELAARARDALDAISTHDMRRLAEIVHPDKGVRFSPYAYVHRDSDVVLRREQLRGLWTDTTTRVWGRFDGSGEPIRMTYPQYHARFVYSADFARAPRTAIDSMPLQPGNTPSNLRATYPDVHWIELHFPGSDPRYGGMDWSSLWLVFEPIGTRWYLVGIVHGSWTI